MKRNKPLSLYLILALLSLPVIWIPAIQQFNTQEVSILNLRTWFIVNLLASIGIILLFCILFILTKYRNR
ncbi:MAG: hypothetical protein ACR2PY_01265 [Salinispira sp.]